MYDFSAIGELLIDFTFSGYQGKEQPTYMANPGGAPPNVASSLGSLGLKPAFISKVGQDVLGKFCIDALKQKNVDTSGIIVDSSNTTLAFVHNDANGDRSFSFYRDGCADTLITPQEVNMDIIKNSRIFQFGTLTMTTDCAFATTVACLEQCKKSGVMVSFDPNLRMNLWRDTDKLYEGIMTGMQYANIAKISDNECEFITGTSDTEDAANFLLEKFPNIKIVLVTCGPDGAYFKTRTLSGFAPAYKVKAIDTTGSGDGFTGGFLYKILQQDKELEVYTSEELLEAIKFGCAVGGLVATRFGALMSMPTMDEIEKFISENK